MADEAKRLEHIVHGHVPADEWEKFLKTHFKPGKAPATPQGKLAPAMMNSGICTWFGCPASHPISGTALNGCSAVAESDGSLTIHCYYEPVAHR
ncbi:MAG: hypothetical protein WDN23_11575 [Edaphobacter sp.]